MRVEIWSDIVCPWCYIGKRRFEKALSLFDARDDVQIHWRSFELDSSAPVSSDQSMVERLSRKYRMTEDEANDTIANITNIAQAEGLEYHLASVIQANSFDAHRLIQLASLNRKGGEMKEILLKAYFIDSLNISEREVLVSLGEDAGLDPNDVRAMYLGDYMSENVRSDEALASRYGISGVPFFVFEGKYGVSGAQTSTVFLEVLRNIKKEQLSSRVEVTGSTDPGCSDDACVI